MQFTLATFITLVAAVAAMPQQKTENSVKQASTKQDIDVLQNKCGDLIVNCCIIHNKDDHSEKGLNLLNNALGLNPPNNAYCSPYASQGVIPINLGQLLGFGTDSKVCDVPNVTYACCTESECTEIGEYEEAAKDDY
ncbi:hypothetical protein BJX66DRAFT_344584 [Aspergillus keveii]|uniref:Hydrophobin n=1 Tax=Aspergillus keveii TaxID=714993 RepID=A0ABR4FKU0_9EURO